MAIRSYPAGVTLLQYSPDRKSTNSTCRLVDSTYCMVRPRSDYAGASRHGRDEFRYAVP